MFGHPWDDTEYMRDDLLLQADELEEIMLWEMGQPAEDMSEWDLVELLEAQEAA